MSTPVKSETAKLFCTKDYLKAIISFGEDLFCQQFRQKQVYKKVLQPVDLIEDHKIAHLEAKLRKDNTYSFQLVTEACLNIATIIDCGRTGYNGMFNVFPFTSMPSMVTSAIVKPLMKKRGCPIWMFHMIQVSSWQEKRRSEPLCTRPSGILKDTGIKD